MGNCFTSRSNSIVDKYPSKRWRRGKGVWMGIENVLGRDFRNICEFYALGKVIGKGRFGLIREAAHRESKKLFACKSVLKKNLETAEALGGVRREVCVMEHLKANENVVQLEEVYEDKEYIHIVMELCSGDNLLQSVTAVEHYSERDAANTIKSVLEVVAQMHSENIVHRDVRPQNFLFSKRGEGAKVKAIHFGCAAFFNGNEHFEEFFGGAQYVAPEVINGAYSAKADVWSCGVILFILLSGMPPFSGTDERDTFCRVLRGRPDYTGKAWRHISPAAKKCLKRLLHMDPRRRSSAQSLLSDPWLVENGTASTKPIHPVVFGRLKSLTAMDTVNTEALRLIAYNVEKDEITELLHIFRELDSDRRGWITIKELRAGVNELKITLLDEKLELLTDAVDVDQEGAINYEGFVCSVIRLYESKKEDASLEAFKYWDTNGDGCICKKEMVKALGDGFDSEQVEDIIDLADQDGDGVISFSEYKALMEDSLSEDNWR